MPTPGVAHQRDDVRLALLDRVAVDRLQQLELRVAPDEGPRAAAQAARPHQRQRADERLRDHGLRLALRVDLERRPELEGAAHGLGGPRADDDRAGRAACSSRAATLTASPVTNELPSRARPDDDLAGVDADPQLEPAVEDAPSRRCIASAACSARSAWSSCASGTPKTAITASPANFSTVPPARPISSAIAS